ncbi:MAG: DUF1573 domain-containing protein [Chitinophagaceae bacterium]|nr:DUF1573 domain-containing protein [Chitinophagaceae bacterium]MCB0740964.1 DUF1573 domain-containing protein [Chitinophagaceae bacterium]HQU57085.1 DUF1573 domain-containing protein [Chitinophagaceae bacterium]
MKKIILFAGAFLLTLSVFAQTKVDDVIKFNVESHDFGKIKQSVPVSYYFEITNISDKPVVVQNSWASCGCTTPEKITDPILPGATAKLKVTYNAAAVSTFHKDVFVQIAGCDKPKNVKISGTVLSTADYAKYEKDKAQKGDDNSAKTNDNK